MPLDDGPFPCGRIYIYIIRPSDDSSYPLKDIYLSFSSAAETAYKLAKEHNKPFHIDVYEEAFNHQLLKHGYTYKMNDKLNNLIH